MNEEKKDLPEEKIEEKEIGDQLIEEGDEAEAKKGFFPRVLFILLVLAVAGALYYFLIYSKADKDRGKSETPPAVALDKEALLPAPSDASSKPPVVVD